MAERQRFRVDESTRQRMLERFIEVANAGDLPAMKALFATDAHLVSDGGGKAVAARRILHGAERIALLFQMIFRRNARGIERRLVRINGELGFATWFRGKLHSVTSIDTDGRRIYGYYTVANPDKLSEFLPAA
jgi:RNA polymerase sigma-70 factor (ECF subfamily)